MVLIRMASRDVLSIPREAQYIMGKDYSVSIELDGETVFLTVPTGMLVDVASIPKAARSVVGVRIKKRGRALSSAASR
jgi:hypothetical protein